MSLTGNDFKAVIFDLDGTLLDSIEDIADAVNAGLSYYGVPAYAVDDYKLFVGDGIDTLARRVLPAHLHADDTMRDFVRSIKREYHARWNAKTHPYEDICELLQELTNRHYLLAVLSNKPHDFTVTMVEALLPGCPFAMVLGASERFPKKPDPAAAFFIAEHLHVHPSQCIYLGDTDTDMQTASAAGMYAVGVLWGFRDENELKTHGADVVIQRPLALLTHLEQNR